MTNHDPSRGLPARSALDATGLHVALVDIAPEELREPFLHETVQRLPGPATVVHTPSGQLGREPASAAPAGVIFHVSRCGSTVQSQMLKQHGGVVVYAEPLAVNELLAGSQAGDLSQRAAALRSLGARFAAHARRPYVLKLSSWNLLYGDLVAKAFPESPWALALRDPLEVCVSLQSSPPSWLRPENASAFAGLPDLVDMPADTPERAARFVAAFLRAAMRRPRERGLIVPYESLPFAVPDELLAHFGLPQGPAVRERMLTTARFHSKADPDRQAVFAADTEQKRATASVQLRDAVDRLARAEYEALMSQRLTKISAPPR